MQTDQVDTLNSDSSNGKMLYVGYSVFYSVLSFLNVTQIFQLLGNTAKSRCQWFHDRAEVIYCPTQDERGQSQRFVCQLPREMAEQDTSMYLEYAIGLTLTKCSEACVVLFGDFTYFVDFENCHL